MPEWILDRVFFCLFHRFSAGVVHSFTDSAEDRDKLLTFNNIYIGEVYMLPVLCYVLPFKHSTEQNYVTFNIKISVQIM